MTIGIGVLCSTEPRPHVPRPDALVMIADTMGSTETDSTGELHKMYFFPEEQVFAVCADRLERAADLFPLVRDSLKAIQEPRSHGAMLQALNEAVHKHRSDHFKWDVVFTRYAIGGQILAERQDRLYEEWGNYDVGAQILLGTFDNEGFARLYYLGQFDGIPGLVHTIAFPGFISIGTGSPNATMWLNYRRQNFALNVKRSTFHAYEASLLAAKAPTVNVDIEMLIATSTGACHYSRDGTSHQGSGISLSELANLFKKYGPQSTEDLGFKPTSSVGEALPEDQ